MALPETIQLVKEVRSSLAGHGLTKDQAKLYSQRLRREMGQEGLASFSASDVTSYLDEAIFLLDCALIEREADPAGAWRQGVRRAGEILEWLSQPDLRPAGVPMHFLSAAAYQLAGYPAMALGHLQRMPVSEEFSVILRELLRNNFSAVLEAVSLFWKVQFSLTAEGDAGPSDLSVLAMRHSVMCIGTVCAYFRTGNITMLERALRKLDALADGFLHSLDPYSFLLARLTAITCRTYTETCLWPQIGILRASSPARASSALTHFAKAAFINCRSLIWPAQAAGIQRLSQHESFVLCTPTGSGKTMVATLAIVQGLFSEVEDVSLDSNLIGLGNLILYLVPSRALAAEIESRLSQDLKGISAHPVVVTGLYGGIDWGPTDAWIQTESPTIVICTFEKADALLRYLGVLFLTRIRLVIIDEAHMVEHNTESTEGLSSATSRPYRLEQLGTRLLRAQEIYPFRIIALSAVASQAAPALARWIGADSDAHPTTSDYRSTRQMLGRLEISPTGRFTIYYESMDGRSLEFDGSEAEAESPYIKEPFPPVRSSAPSTSMPEKAMRAPALWAALHLAAERPDGTRPSVLISLTQNVDTFAEDCANFLRAWNTEQLPIYHAVEKDDEKWSRCLAITADYFGKESVEYRLLEFGIAVHHGKMPALLARRLKGIIDCGYVRVIIATSTLSEGVNIPVNYVLIPNLYRATSGLSLQEFTNLIGRAGRPGVSTEGHALVVLPQAKFTRQKGRWVKNRQWERFNKLSRELKGAAAIADRSASKDSASSALARLLLALESAWRDIAGNLSTIDDFTEWLERTAVIDTDNDDPAISYLDSLDVFLIAAIQEIDELRGKDIPPDSIEEELLRIWRRTYAYAAAREEKHLQQIWLTRGKAIKVRYPEAAQRKRIYKSSLTPRSAVALERIIEAIRDHFQTGRNYSLWDENAQLAFIGKTLNLLSDVPSFQISNVLGRKKNFGDWLKLLRWWLAKRTLDRHPLPREITTWFNFVAQNFIYRGTWGLGSALGLLLDLNDEEGPIRALEISDWPRSGLPWIAFWMKELLLWGTLDPVATFLLSRGDVNDRQQAENEAQEYYAEQESELEANEVLDPRKIRDWVDSRRTRPARKVRPMEIKIEIDLERDREAYLTTHLTVTPIEFDERINWIDPAGYTVGHSARPADWLETPATYDFELDVIKKIVIGTAYLPYSED